MAFLPDIKNLNLADDDDDSSSDSEDGHVRPYRDDQRYEGRGRHDDKKCERRGQRHQEELARRSARAAERQEKKDELKLVGAWVDVLKVTGGYIAPGWDAIHLSLSVLKRLKWVSWDFKGELPNMRLTKIEYVLNETLYDTFNQTKAEFQRQGKDTKEILLFHGTKPENVNR
jgi:hypothetical protein